MDFVFNCCIPCLTAVFAQGCLTSQQTSCKHVRMNKCCLEPLSLYLHTNKNYKNKNQESPVFCFKKKSDSVKMPRGNILLLAESGECEIISMISPTTCKTCCKKVQLNIADFLHSLCYLLKKKNRLPCHINHQQQNTAPFTSTIKHKMS